MVCLGLEPGAAEWKAEINLFEYKKLLKITHRIMQNSVNFLAWVNIFC